MTVNDYDAKHLDTFQPFHVSSVTAKSADVDELKELAEWAS